MYAIRLTPDVQPNDRMFFDTVEEVVDAIRWALPRREVGAEIVLTIEPA